MATQPQGMSLLFALLETELYTYDPTKFPKESKEAENDRQRADDYRNMKLSDQKQVLGKLYRALYQIVQYSDINRDLNRAIGMALSNAIRGGTVNLQNDENVKRLYSVLKPIVREAIDEIVPRPSEHLTC